MEGGIGFLTATGKMCDDIRQEFILLSDTLGLSMLVDHQSRVTRRLRPRPACSVRSIAGCRSGVSARTSRSRDGDAGVRSRPVCTRTAAGRRRASSKCGRPPERHVRGQDPAQPDGNLRGRFRTRRRRPLRVPPSCRRAIRFRPTARSARCSSRRAVIRCAPRICTSGSTRPATVSSSRIYSTRPIRICGRMRCSA